MWSRVHEVSKMCVAKSFVRHTVHLNKVVSVPFLFLCPPKQLLCIPICDRSVPFLFFSPLPLDAPPHPDEAGGHREQKRYLYNCVPFEKKQQHSRMRQGAVVFICVLVCGFLYSSHAILPLKYIYIYRIYIIWQKKKEIGSKFCLGNL